MEVAAQKNIIANTMAYLRTDPTASTVPLQRVCEDLKALLQVMSTSESVGWGRQPVKATTIFALFTSGNSILQNLLHKVLVGTERTPPP